MDTVILHFNTKLTPHIHYTFCSDCGTLFQTDSCLHMWDMYIRHAYLPLKFLYFQLKNFMKNYDGVAAASFSRAVETVEANVRWKMLYQDELFQWLGKALRH